VSLKKYFFKQLQCKPICILPILLKDGVDVANGVPKSAKLHVSPSANPIGDYWSRIFPSQGSIPGDTLHKIGLLEAAEVGCFIRIFHHNFTDGFQFVSGLILPFSSPALFSLPLSSFCSPSLISAILPCFQSPPSRSVPHPYPFRYSA
jgi:hypothetical protein